MMISKAGNNMEYLPAQTNPSTRDSKVKKNKNDPKAMGHKTFKKKREEGPWKKTLLLGCVSFLGVGCWLGKNLGVQVSLSKKPTLPSSNHHVFS